MSKAICSESAKVKNESLSHVIYFVAVPLKFYLFYRNYAKICLLMKTSVSKLKEKSMERAKTDEREIEKVAKVVGLMVICSEVLYFYYLIQTTPRNFVDIATEIISFPSLTTIDFIVFILQFMYLNFCIQICSLFKQIEDDFNDMRFIRDKVRVPEMLGEIVEFHDEIQQIISDLLDCFKNVLSLNFVVNIWLAGQASIFSSDSNWVGFVITLPFLLFDAWIYCFSSQMITTKVRTLNRMIA